LAVSGLALGDVRVHDASTSTCIMKDSFGYSFLTSTSPVRISSHRGDRKKVVIDQEQRLRSHDAGMRSRTQLTTASGSRERIVRPITFFTLQYEHVNGHPREVSSVVIVSLKNRVR